MHNLDDHTRTERLLAKIRTLRGFLTDEEIVKELVDNGTATPEDMFLLMACCKILDGNQE